MRPRIAILGSAPSSVHLAPFRDKRWQIWACSPANLQQKLPRVDVWFEMHSWNLEQKRTSNPPYWDFLKQQKRVVMQQPDPEFPGSMAYPLAEVKKRWPWGARYFLTSSPALMMAFALLQEPEAMGLWGIDMAGHTEWQWQRPGCHYWMEKAEAQGCHIITPGEADILCPPPTYGFCESTHMWRKLNARKREIERRMEAATQRGRQAEHERLILQGAHESTVYEMRTWLPDSVDPRALPTEEEAKAQAEDAVAVMAPPTVKTPAKPGQPTQDEFLKALAMSKVAAKTKRANGKAKKNQAKKQTTQRGATGSPPPLSGAGPLGGSSDDNPPPPRG